MKFKIEKMKIIIFFIDYVSKYKICEEDKKYLNNLKINKYWLLLKSNKKLQEILEDVFFVRTKALNGCYFWDESQEIRKPPVKSIFHV